jgi:hypothetical protein
MTLDEIIEELTRIRKVLGTGDIQVCIDSIDRPVEQVWIAKDEDTEHKYVEIY